MNKYLPLFFVFFIFELNAQSKKEALEIDFNFKFGALPLQLNQTYISKKQDTLLLDVFKFYVSDFKVEFDDTSKYVEKSSHLIDLEDSASQKITLQKSSKKKIKKIEFFIGVDSLASVSGALSGDLDPSHGMYWAWQSGYINLKLEGKSNSCKTRKNAFFFHIGGYLQPNLAVRKVVLFPKENTTITVNVASLFSEIDLNTTNSVMIPGKKAMEFADLTKMMFLIE